MSEKRPLSVTQLNDFVKMIVDNNPVLSNVCVCGEISNHTKSKTGHIYFTLKDEQSSVRAVMFAREAYKLKFETENGMHVIVTGRLSVYQRDGNYQIYCTGIEPEGLGSLYLAFEQLKLRLDAEGLFEAYRKKPLPPYPKKVGVVTSPTGAAIKDILNISSRRYPCAEVLVYPSLVQGSEAEQQLIEGIKYFDSSDVDVVIIGRGGGSTEDLWVFNSERLARVIAVCAKPVVSAVGHERDVTICDLVADLRAPTPSAAAELVFPDKGEMRHKLIVYYNRLKGLMNNCIASRKMQLDTLKRSRPLTAFSNTIDDKRIYADTLARLFEQKADSYFKGKRHAVQLLAARLDGASPLAPLARGYSVTKKDGVNVTDAKCLTVGDTVEIIFKNGAAEARITETENERKNGL